MSGRSCCRFWGPMVLVACAVPISGQAPPPRPPDLFVTRLQGPGGVPASSPASPQPPTELPPLPVTQLDDQSDDINLDGPRRISLTVSRPMPLSELLLLLVNGTPLSLVNDDAVEGAFVGELKNLTMRQAIEAVLFPRDLDYDVQGSLIRVFPRKTSTRLFNVNYLNVRRTLQQRVGSNAAGLNGSASVSTDSDADFLGGLEKGVGALLSPSGRMHLDRVAGIVQVTDFADRLDQIGVYIEAAELRATRQIRLDAHVFEIVFGEGTPAAIDWKAVAARSGSSQQGPSSYPTAGLPIASLDALKRAIGEQGTLTTLASHQMLALNNEPAILRIGTAVAGIEDDRGRSRNNDGSRVGPPPVTGLTLTVVPQIAADGIVQLQVSPAYASRVQSGQDAVVRTNDADTVVRVRDGETILLAGFPGERDIAKTATGFGAMFGGSSHTTVQTEIVILLTATIVAPASGAAY